MRHEGKKDENYEYDVLLSHAGEDTDWSEQLAARLRNEGVRVWFDAWYLKAGHNLDVELNKAIERIGWSVGGT